MIKMKKPLAFCLTLLLAFGMWGIVPGGLLAPDEAYGAPIGLTSAGFYYISNSVSQGSIASGAATYASDPAILEDGDTLHFHDVTPGAFDVQLSGSGVFTIIGTSGAFGTLNIYTTGAGIGDVNLTVSGIDTATNTSITLTSAGVSTLNLDSSTISAVDFATNAGFISVGGASKILLSGSGIAITGGSIDIDGGSGLEIAGDIVAQTTDVAISGTIVGITGNINAATDVIINNDLAVTGGIIAGDEVIINDNLTVNQTAVNEIGITATTTVSATSAVTLNVNGGPSAGAISATAVDFVGRITATGGDSTSAGGFGIAADTIKLNNVGNSTIKAGNGESAEAALRIDNNGTLTILGAGTLTVTGGNSSVSALETTGNALLFADGPGTFKISGNVTATFAGGTTTEAGANVSSPAISLDGANGLTQSGLTASLTAITTSHDVTKNEVSGAGTYFKKLIFTKKPSAPDDDDSSTGGGGGGAVTTPTETTPPTTSDPVNRMTDVAGHWGYEAIEYVLDNHYMNGVSETEFAPNLTVNRAMVAQVFANMSNFFANNYKESPYNDTDIGAWYGPAVAWANEQNVMSGVGNDNFAPIKNVTREELAVALYNYAKSQGMDVTVDGDLAKYTDASNVSSWARDAFIWASANGIISGKPDGDSVKLDPKGMATRAEFASMLYKFDLI